MKIINAGVTAPKGFKCAGLRAGVKPGKTNKDMAMIVSEVPAKIAGTFTKNIVKAAPVLWGKKIVEEHGGKIWATSREETGTTMYFVLRKYQEVPVNE